MIFFIFHLISVFLPFTLWVCSLRPYAICLKHYRPGHEKSELVSVQLKCSTIQVWHLMSCFLLAFYCSASFGSEQPSGYKVHTNKIDIALSTVIRIAIYCVCSIPRRMSISSESSFSKTENTNNPEKYSRNNQTEASDPYTREQANIQPCGDLALVLWFVLFIIILHCILRSPFCLLVLPLTACLFLTTALLSTSLICISSQEPTQHAFCT